MKYSKFYGYFGRFETFEPRRAATDRPYRLSTIDSHWWNRFGIWLTNSTERNCTNCRCGGLYIPLAPPVPRLHCKALPLHCAAPPISEQADFAPYGTQNPPVLWAGRTACSSARTSGLSPSAVFPCDAPVSPREPAYTVKGSLLLHLRQFSDIA